MMKKNFTFLLLLIPALFFAQSQRVVLVEEGSNASCGPCAAANPAFHSLLTPFEDAGDVVVLKYQWYFPGYDPMNEHNPTEADGRFNGYYGENGVPTGMLDGNVFVDHIASFNSTMIQNRIAVPSSFDITIDADLNAAFTELTVNVDVSASEAIANNSNLKLRMAVVERVITFDTAPGSNGEKVFYNVMKKMLPNMTGNNLPATWTNGQTESFTETWTLANVYDISQLAVVVFVQDDDNKEVMQSARGSVNFTVANATGAAALSGSAIDAGAYEDALCQYSVAPTVVIRNQGNDDLTSLDIEYSVNGASVHTYTWTGNLPTLNSETVTLPEVYFFHEATGNSVDISLKNPNGTADPDMSDNNLSLTFDKAPDVSTNVEMTFNHDQYGSEITWELRNSSGAVVESGGPYADAVGTETETWTLASGECYEFIVLDSYGDGQIGGATGVTLTDVDSGTDFVSNFNDYGSEGKAFFGVGSDALRPDSSQVFTGIIDANVITEMSVYPNPASDVLNVKVVTDNNAAMTVSLVDILGRTVATTSINNGIASFNTSNITSGLYIVNVKADGKAVGASTVVVK